jgi:hypothetical protein
MLGFTVAADVNGAASMSVVIRISRRILFRHPWPLNTSMAACTPCLPVPPLKEEAFYWQPGPGFLGENTMKFARPDGSTIPVRVTIVPKRYSIRSLQHGRWWLDGPVCRSL